MRELPNIVKYSVSKFREDAKLLEDMAGIYPGDITGEIRKQSWIMEVMAELLEGFDWEEQLEDYEADQVEVILYDAEGNQVHE